MTISPSSRGEDDFIESRIPWLKKVPSNWSTQKVKYLFSERVQKGFPDEPLLAATQTQGVVRKEMYETRTVTAQKDLHLLKLVEVGDFVISLRSFQGGIEYAHNRGIISPAYTILKPRSTILPRFYAYLLKSTSFIDSLSLFVTGIREGQNIDYTKFSRSELPVPPLEEQQKIVNFIQQQDRRIRRLIKNKKRLIALLEEQRRALVTATITRGLDTKVQTSNSGQFYLGDIPAHWQIKKLKFLLTERLKYGANEAAELENRSFPRFIRITDITETGALRDETFRSIPDEVATPYIMTDGDILLARSGATVGKTFIYRKDWGRACYAGYLIRARMRSDKVLPDYFYLYTNSSNYLLWISSVTIQATIQNVSAEKYANFFVPVPPLHEQKSIVEYINKSTIKFDQLIDRTHTEIRKIGEYRSRLISDAVTGKIDLRSISLETTEESPEEDLTDISENGFDANAEIGTEEDELLEEAAHAN